MRLFTNANYKFIEARKKGYLVSTAMVTLGLIGVILNFFTIGSWANYGVDFTGGTLIQVRTQAGVTDADLREALGGVNAPPITRFGSENEFVIRTPGREGVAVEEIVGPIRAQLEASPNVGEFEIVRTEFVGPKVGAELNRRAAIAILMSLVLVLIYLGFRFEVRFGWAAVIATAHDILVTLAFVALFRVEVSLTTVAAVLTVIGYSLNDTIVIFDRIRENLNIKGGRREDPTALVNRSINETLPRTAMTGGATIAVLISLLIFGGPVIRDFTIVLLLGIVLGTYSSIFIGAPALLEIQNRWGTKEESTRKKELKRTRSKPTVPV